MRWTSIPLKGEAAASASLSPDARQHVLAPQKGSYERFLATQVFTAAPGCVDQRSSVLTAADLDAALGDREAEQAVLRKAIDVTREQSLTSVG